MTRENGIVVAHRMRPPSCPKVAPGMSSQNSSNIRWRKAATDGGHSNAGFSTSPTSLRACQRLRKISTCWFTLSNITMESSSGNIFVIGWLDLRCRRRRRVLRTKRRDGDGGVVFPLGHGRDCRGKRRDVKDWQQPESGTVYCEEQDLGYSCGRVACGYLRSTVWMRSANYGIQKRGGSGYR